MLKSFKKFINLFFVYLLISSCTNYNKITITKLENSPSFENASLSLQEMKIENNEHIKVQGIMYSLGSIFLLLGHLYSGIFNKYTFSLSLSLVPLCIVGLFIGSIIRNKIKQTTFKTFTLVMILLASINLLRKAFL